MHNAVKEQDNAVKEQHNAVKEQHNAVKEQHNAMKEQHNVVKEQDNAVKEQHNAMKEQHNAVKEQHNAVKEQHNAVKEQHNAVKEQHNAVKEQHNAVKEQHNAVKEQHNAVKEQQALNLPWYTTLLELWNHEDEHDDSAIPNSKKDSQAIQEKFQNCFIAIWSTERLSNRKLRFYNTIKDSFSQEKYLRTQRRNQGRAADLALAKLRMSAHKLNIETGRYKNKPVETRICHLC